MRVRRYTPDDFERTVAPWRFYERRGFEVVRYGTSPPPENEPDVEYRWQPTP